MAAPRSARPPRRPATGASATHRGARRSRPSPITPSARPAACPAMRRRYTPSPRHQRGVGAALGHPALVEHQDAIRADDAREPVGEDQRGAPAHQPVERVLDDGLALRVHRGERLVQDQDRRVAEQRARDRDALALAARQPHPALAHHRLVALGQRHDERRACWRCARPSRARPGSRRAGPCAGSPRSCRGRDRCPGSPPRSAAAGPGARARAGRARRSSRGPWSDRRSAAGGARSWTCPRRSRRPRPRARPRATLKESASSAARRPPG